MSKKSYQSQLSGQIGESLVVAELGRREIVATSFSGNVPEIDLLAWRNGRSIGLQVKSLKKGTFGVDARNYIEIEQCGDLQKLGSVLTDMKEDLIYVFVFISENYGSDEFYLISQRELATIIHRSYSEYLTRHRGVRPRNSKATHSSILKKDLEPFKNCWEILEGYLPN